MRAVIPAFTWLAWLAASSPETPPSIQPDDSRALRIGASYVVRVPDDLDITGAHGAGIWSDYEFLLSPSFALGIHLALRGYPDGDRLLQLGYGLTLRHTFVTDGPLDLFLTYGLLVQSSWLEGRSSYATSHNTLLGAGAIAKGALEGGFVQLGYNLSGLRFFDSDTTNASFAEVTLGTTWTW
ncbi:MAG: hypothetical protein AAF219_01205 [Myxococcota bacterium]